jgi:hypothetical protein
VFVSVDGAVTGSVADLVFADKTKNIQLDIDLDENATFEDVIKMLMDQNDVVLNTTQNIKFTYISNSSEDYDYYRTAYDKKMIGK